ALNVNILKVYSLTGVLVRNKIYYHGGLQSAETNDFIPNILHSSDIIKLSKIFTDSDFFSFPYHNAFHIRSNKIYFFGGQRTDDNESIFGRYDIKNRNWKVFKNSTESPFNLEDHSCVMANNGLFVIFGGKILVSGASVYSKDIYIANTNSEHWGNNWINPIFTYGPGPRAFHSATILPDGRMVVLGGRTNDSMFAPMSEIWVYNIDMNEWQNIVANGDIPSPRSGHSTILTSDNKIIIYGGTSDVNLSQPLAVLDTSVWMWSQKKIISSIERYCYTTNTVCKQLIITFGNEPKIDPLNDITILNITIWAINTTSKSEILSINEEMSPSSDQKVFAKRSIYNNNNEGTMIIVIIVGITVIFAGTFAYLLYLWLNKRRKRRQKRNVQSKRHTAADDIAMLLGFFGKSLEPSTAPGLELDSIIVPESNYSQSINDSGTGTPLSSKSPLSLLSANQVDHSSISHLTRKPTIPHKPLSIPQPIMEIPSRSASSLSHPVSRTPTPSTSSDSSRKQSRLIIDDGLLVRPRQVYKINSRTLRRELK
ncbi:2514_t:CDS:2, partial [Dentiscutata heterogama]